jgi:ComF family protein
MRFLAMNLLDLIFPNDIYCIACGRPLAAGSEAALCDRCMAEVHWTAGRLCKKCGKLLAENNRKTRCYDCAQEEHLFEKGYACALYDGPAAKIVRDMKYRSLPSHAETVAAFLAARIKAAADAETGELPNWDAVIPVPMHKGKREKRGYNQAELIARGLARRLGLPLLARALVRRRDTGVMSSLSLWERKQNLIDAFCVGPGETGKLHGKAILLVDDVYTTGSTADACAEVLLKAGCTQVDLIVFATGADGGQNLSQDDEPDAELFQKSADNPQFC